VNAPPATAAAVRCPARRCAVGDIVQLTFLNHISTSGFLEDARPGKRTAGDRCDQIFGALSRADEYPNRARLEHGNITSTAHTRAQRLATIFSLKFAVHPTGDEADRHRDSVRAPFAEFFANCG
jgi:hypothetical protein